MSLRTHTWAQHFLAITEGETPENTIPIWNAFMAQLADALNKPKVDDELRQRGRTSVHFNITPEQLKLLQEEGGASRILDGLGVREEQRSKFNILVSLFGLEGDPRGPCVQVEIWRPENEPKKPGPVPIPAGTLGPERELEPDVDLPDCDSQLCDNVQNICIHATWHEESDAADWFLGKAYIHKYTAREEDFRKALKDDPEFVRFLARQLRREEYGPEAMQKMHPVVSDCIHELHGLVSKKVQSDRLTCGPNRQSHPHHARQRPRQPQPWHRPSSPPPWPWRHREAADADN